MLRKLTLSLLVCCLLCAMPVLAEIVVDPDVVELELPTGLTMTEELTFSNDGEAVDFTIEIIPVEEEMRDNRSDPDDMGYEWRDNLEDDGPEFEWVDVRELEGRREFRLGDDANTGALQLGWTFPFWDREFEVVYANTDAWTSFTYSGNAYNNSPAGYPLAANGNARNANFIQLMRVDHTRGTEIWFWTNENDEAWIMWAGNHDRWFELALYGNGYAQMQYGDNNQARDFGVNLGDGDHGWYMGNQLEPGRAVGFGPANAWEAWIAADPVEGELAGGGEVVIDLNINTMGLEGGVYEADLVFTPSAGDAIEVPISVTVEGGPAIFSDVLEWDFGEIYVGVDNEAIIPIENIGQDVVVIEEIASDNPDLFFGALPDGGLEIAPGEVGEVTIVANLPDAGEAEATLVCLSNALNYPEFPFPVTAVGMARPEIFVEPDAIEEEMMTGDVIEDIIEISNIGGNDLFFEISHEIIENDRDDNSRSVRSTNGTPVGPRRDEINVDDISDMRFAVVQTSSNWGFLFDGMGQDELLVANENWFNFRDANWWNDADFSEYNAIVMSTYSQQFNNQYNENLERLEEYIADGGGYYAEMGDANRGVRTPGGFMNDWAINSSNGFLVVSPDPGEDNYSYFAEICHETQPNFWNVDERIEGSSWLHSGFQLAQFNNAVEEGTIDWYQVLAVHERDRNAPGAIAYQLGNGICLINGHPVGHCWQWFADEGEWGSIAAEILYYITSAGSPAWFSYEPTEGEIAPDDMVEIMVTLDATGLVTGVYEADLHIMSNDPVNEDVIVSVVADVTGAPDLVVEWAPGFPDAIDWNAQYDELFSNGAYDVTLDVSNDGTEVLVIEDIFTEHDFFATDFEDEMVLEVGEGFVLTLTYSPAEAGEHEAVLMLVSDDPDGEMEIAMFAASTNPPMIVVDPDAIEEEMVSGEIVEHIINIGNEGDADLNGYFDIEVIQEPGDDDVQRSVRSTDGPARALPRDNRSEPDDMDYEWRDNLEDDGPEFEWVDVTALEGRREFRLGDDVNTGAVELGWDFPLWDREYSQVFADTDGWMSFSYGGRNIMVGAGAYPVAAGAGQFRDATVAILNDDNLAGTDIYIYTNENDFAAIEWHGDHRFFFELLLYDSGLGVMQYGEAANQNTGEIGVNLGDGNHGWFISGRNNQYAIPGRAIGFGPAAGWLSWISVEPMEFSIEPEGEEDFVLTLDATGLIGGMYSAEVTIISNDPDDGEYVIGVDVEVTGAPHALLEWPEEWGWAENPEEWIIDWNEAFVEVFAGGPYDVAVNLTNDGTEELVVRDIYSEHDYFMADFEDEFVLAVGESVELTFTFDCPADDPGDYNAEMIFESDNMNEDEAILIPLHATSQLPPEIFVDPDAIEAELVVGAMTEETIEIGNDGEALLRWTSEFIEVEDDGRDLNSRSVRNTDGVGPRRDDAGDLLFQFNGINAANQYSSCIGWDWDNERMWVTNYSSASAAAYNLDGEEMIRINPGNCMDGCWANGLLFLGRWANGALNRWDADGQNIGAIQFPFAVYGIAADIDQQLFLVMESGNQNAIHVYPITEDNRFGQEIGVIRNHMQYHGNVACYGLEWVPAHGDAPLWMTNAGGGSVFQIAVNQDDWTCTETIQTWAAGGLGQPYCSVAHDGENMWASGYTAANIRIYDDGAAESNWFSYEPTEGEVESGDTGEIFVTLSAAGAQAGMYEGDLMLYTNDPANAEVAISVALEVFNAPDIEVVWDEDWGYPDVLDWNQAYIEIFSGGPYDLTVNISNEGTEVLVIDDIFCEHDYFNCDFDDEIVLEIGEETEATITFEAPANDPGDYEAVWVFLSNDTDEEELEIALHCEALTPPIIVVEPELIESALITGEIEEYIIDVANDGQALLRANVGIEITGEPGDDAELRSVRNTSGAPVGPRRDDFNMEDILDKRIACVQDRSTWGWLFDLMGRDEFLVGDENWFNIRDGNWWNDADFDDFDAIVTSAYNQGFANQYNNNRERLEEWVDAGGGFYMEMANANPPIHAPGDLYNNVGQSSRNGVLAVSPDPADDNYSYFAEIVHERQPNHWNEGEVIEGSSWLHAGYTVDQFDNAVENGVIEWYQVIANQEQNQGTPGCVAYQMGGGICLINAHPVGHCWQNFAQDGMWGSIAAEIIYYITTAGSPAWVSIEPTEFELESGDNIELVVTLDATGLYGGLYEADIIFESNDPADPAVVVLVELEVTGAPDIDVTWDEGIGFPDVMDWDEAFIEVFAGGPYAIPVVIANIGTEDLVVDEISSEHDYFYSDGEEGFVVGPESEAVVNMIFDAAEPGDYNAEIVIFSDDPDEEEIVIALHGAAQSPPLIFVDPQLIEEDIVDGDVVERSFTIGNEGEALLRWYLEIIEIEDEERDVNLRSVRGTDGTFGPRRDPLPEEPVEASLAMVYESNPWGYDLQRIPQAMEELEWTRYRNFGEDIDLDEFDILWCGNYQQDGWNNTYNENVERISEWVDGGGSYYMCTGTNNYNVNPTHPGGLNYTRGGNTNSGRALVNAEDCYLFEMMEWDENTRYAGNSFNHVHYTEQTLNTLVEENNNVDEYRVLIDNGGGLPVVVEYGFGRGFCVVTGTTDGFLHNNPGAYNWGGSGPAMVYYLEASGNMASWLTVEPLEGEVEAGDEVDVFVTFGQEGGGIYEGVYEADIHVMNNDPSDPDVVVTVVCSVTGHPQAEVTWDDEIGFPDEVNWNTAYPDLFTGGNGYPIALDLSNPGTGALVVESIECDHAFYSLDLEGDFVVPFQETQVVTVTLLAEEDGNHEGDITFTFGGDLDPIVVHIIGETTAPPILVVDPEDDIEEALNTGDVEEYIVNISNAGDADLRWWAEFEELEEEERDANLRNVRSTDGAQVGPRRDEPGEILGNFAWGRAPQNTYKSGIAWDYDQEMMWLNNYSRRNVGLIDREDDFREVATFNTNAENGMNMFYREGELYFVAWANQNQIGHYSVDGDNLGWFQLPNCYPTALTYSPELDLIFAMQANGTYFIHVFAFVDDGVEQIGQIEWKVGNLANRWSRSIQWVDEHPDGKLWLNTTNPSQIVQVAIDEDEWELTEVVQAFDFDNRNDQWSGIGHDGDNLWLGPYQSPVYSIMDDGVAELDWFAFEPEEGTLETDEDVDVVLTFSAVDMLGGVYEGDFNIFSNDPIEIDEVADFSIHATLTVTGVPLVFMPGGPEMEPNDFGLTYLGHPGVMALEVENIGTDDLVIDDYDSDNGVFYVSEDIDFPVVIGPEESSEITVIFAPEEEGDDQVAEFIFVVNDLNYEEDGYPVTFTGDGWNPPVFVVDPDEINTRMAIDEVEELVLNVANEGGHTLSYEIGFDLLEEPGDDNALRSVRSTEGPARVLPRDNRSEPDDAGYEWRDNLEDDGPEFEWVDVTALEGRREFRLGDDVNTGAVELGWDFPLWDREYNQVFADTDGWMSFSYGGRNIMVNAGAYPVAAGAGQFRDATVAIFNDDNLAGTDIYIYTNENDFAAIEWHGDHRFFFELLLYDNGLGVMQYGQAANQNTGEIGVNLGDGDHGWFISGRNNQYAVPGRAIGFGPADGWLSWFMFDPAEGSIEPGEDEDIVVTLNSEEMAEGAYIGVMVFETNDPENPAYELPVTVIMGGDPEPEFYVIEGETERVHTLTVGGLTYDGEEVDFGWEIGVFTPDDVLAAGAVWLDGETSVIVYGAEGELAYFDDGDAFRFEVWDGEEVWNAIPEWDEGPQVWNENGESVVYLGANSDFTIELDLSQNWNMISINVDPTEFDNENGDPDIVDMFQQAFDEENDEHRVELLKDENGLFWAPAWGFINIPFWDIARGYQVKMSEDFQVSFTGAPVLPDAPIEIDPGWNIISYFPQYDLDASSPDFYVLGEVIDNIRLAKDGNGLFMAPAWNFSNMRPWTMGQGYQVASTADETFILNYPAEMQEEVMAVEERVVEQEWISPVTTGSNMSVLINNVSGLALQDGDQIAAFSASNVPLGVATVVDGRCGLPVWGDNVTTEVVENIEEGEFFILKLWDADREETRVLELSTTLEGNGLVYTTDAFTVIDVNVKTLVPDDYYLSQNFPNPFNNITRIAYGIPEASSVTINVYNIAGRLVQTLVSGNLEAGHHVTVWNGQAVSTGMYILRMESAGNTFSQKMMLVK